MARRILWGILVILVAGETFQAGKPAREARLQAVLEVFLAENPGAPGVVATVVCPALGLDWSGAAGTEARGAGAAPLTPRHTLRLASNTKTYVAASVLRLAEMGHLNLDDPLVAHLPSEQAAQLRREGYDVGAITVAQLLSHTAGFGDHSDDERFVALVLAEPHHPWTAAEQLRLLLEWRDPVGKPGEKYEYSDSGYVLLGTLVERWTGRKLGPAVRGLLRYDRLGLQATHWEYMEDPPAAAGPRAHQYLGERDVTAWTASFDLYGGGGLVSDSREMALFLRKLMKGEVFDRKQTLDQMTGRGTLRYRLGLMSAECDGRLALGHQGFWNTFAYHIPSLDLTVAGGVLDHDSTNSLELARRLIAAAAEPEPPRRAHPASAPRLQ